MVSNLLSTSDESCENILEENFLKKMGKVLNLRNDTKMHLQNYKDAMLRMAGGMCVIEIIRDRCVCR